MPETRGGLFADLLRKIYEGEEKASKHISPMLSQFSTKFGKGGVEMVTKFKQNKHIKKA